MQGSSHRVLGDKYIKAEKTAFLREKENAVSMIWGTGLGDEPKRLVGEAVYHGRRCSRKDGVTPRTACESL